jgi:hypothetical protein
LRHNYWNKGAKLGLRNGTEVADNVRRIESQLRKLQGPESVAQW